MALHALEIRSIKAPKLGPGDDVWLELELVIGPKEDAGASMTFEVMVATPRGLLRAPQKNENVIRDRGLIVLREFTWKKLHLALEQILEAACGRDWADSIRVLQRCFVPSGEEPLPAPTHRPRVGDLDIKSMDSFNPEVDEPAPDPKDVCFPLNVTIGIHGHEAADNFATLVVTPTSLLRLATDENILRTRAMIVVPELSWPKLRLAVADIVHQCADTDFMRSTERLQRYFQWEYEGMGGWK